MVEKENGETENGDVFTVTYLGNGFQGWGQTSAPSLSFTVTDLLIFGMPGIKEYKSLPQILFQGFEGGFSLSGLESTAI